MSASGARNHARYLRLKADNRCVGCAEKLAFEDVGECVFCAQCRVEQHETKVADVALWKEAGLCSSCGRERDEQGYMTCRACRARAKRPAPAPRTSMVCRCGAALNPDDNYKSCERCRAASLAYYRAHRDEINRERSPGRGSPAKWAAIDSAASCKRCGLRGDHECVGAAAHATARRVA